MNARDRAKETFRPVPGYEGLYEVSDHGTVRSLRRPGVCAKTLKPETERRGYKRVRLCINGGSKHIMVHRIVAAAFLGPRPEGFQVNHIDENKENNRADNLEYVTPKENSNHGTRNERLSKAHQNHPSKSRAVVQTDKEGKLIREYPSACEASRKTGIDRSTIARCCANQYRSAGGFGWEFK